MAGAYRTGVQRNWNWGAGNPNWDSPSVIAGDIGVTVHLQQDGRDSIGTPTWDGTPMTVARDQSGGGQAWTGACKVCYIKNPSLGVTAVNVSGSDGASIFIYLLSGVNQLGDPVIDVDGRYGFGNPTQACALDVSEGVDVAVGGCHSSNTGAFLTGNNEGISRGSRSPVWDSARSYRFQSSDGALGPQIYHQYDWSGQYADNCVAAVAFDGGEAGRQRNQVVFCMSTIYKRLREIYQKADDGLWKPQPGLVLPI